jgi:hypothetical protein
LKVASEAISNNALEPPPLRVTVCPAPSRVVLLLIYFMLVNVIVPLHEKVTVPPPVIAVLRLASLQVLTFPAACAGATPIAPKPSVSPAIITSHKADFLIKFIVLITTS